MTNGQQRARGGKHQPAERPAVEEFSQLIQALSETWADRLWDAGRDDLSAMLTNLAGAARATGPEAVPDAA